MTQTLNAMLNLFTRAFVVASMLSLALSLTIPQIIAPLRDGQLVALALLANFVIIPAVVLILTSLIPVQEDLRIGISLLGTVAAMVVATGNFADRPNVLVMIVAGLLFLAIFLPTAAERGKRSAGAGSVTSQAGANTKGGEQTITG
jgi:ACR3 family arsenite efflux pump ArsB